MKKILLSILIVFSMIVFGVAQTTTDGLVGYWKFDEGSGTTVSDELGTTDGNLINSVEGTWTTGFSGSALDFSQTSGNPAYAQFDGSGVANINGSFSMAMWIKADLTLDGEQSIISKGVPYLITEGIDGGWYHISLKDGAIRFMLWDQAGNFSSPAGEIPVEVVWDANTWYHIAVVRDTDNSILNVYLNGQLISSDTDAMQESLSNNEDFTLGSVATGVQTETVPSNSTPSEDGSKFWPSNYLGLLDEVQLYNVALTSDQIAGIYDAYVNGSNDARSIAMSKVSVYPNPAMNQISIGGIESGSLISIYSVVGQKVASTISNGNEAIINVGNFKNGVYLVKVELNGKASVGRFIKR